jgi:hypothetical protein
VLVLFYSLLAAMNLGAVFAYQAQALQGARTLKFAESLADPPTGGRIGCIQQLLKMAYELRYMQAVR